MNAYIITIGNELLNGNMLDTNSTWIGKELNKLNINLNEKITIADNKDDIKLAIKNALKKYDFIFITGGLGPTHDDITKEAIRNILQTNEYFDKNYYNELKLNFKRRGIEISESNKSQAMLLKGCIPIKNSIGTALGINFKINNSQVFVMPGVPREMKNMMTEIIIPKYFSEINKIKKSLTLLTMGMAESTISDLISDIINDYNNIINIAFLPSFASVKIRLSIVNNSNFDKLFELKNKIKKRLGEVIFGYDNQRIEQVVGDLLIKNKLTLSIAESCTGGLISKKITNIPGASKYFIGSIIAYNNKIKEQKLNIQQEILEKHGAVSHMVVKTMAQNIKKDFSSDIGLAISGISGPKGGTEDKPVGLVHIALVYKDMCIHKKFNFISERNLHRDISSDVALNMIRLFLIGKQNEL